MERNPLCGTESGEGRLSTGSGGVSLVQCLSGKDTSHLLDMQFWSSSGGARHWEDLLASPGDEGQLKRLKSATYSGKPLGSEDFVKKALSDLAARHAPDLDRKEQGSSLGFPSRAKAGVWAVGG